MQTYFKTDYAQIDYDAESKAIVLIWIVPSSVEEFRSAMENIIGAEEYFKTGKLIVDTNHQGIIHPDNQKWLVTDWKERAIKAGHSHVAIIMPEDIFAMMSIDEVMTDANGLITGYFNNMEDATAWIKQS